MEEELIQLAKMINIDLTEKNVKDFFCYMKMLKEWNNKINLTAITEDKEIILKHFIDSLVILKYIKDNSSLIDVGTGAGFPGIPLKIVKEDIKLTLLDSLKKRLEFLSEVCKTLDISNVNIIHGRAEDYGIDSNYRENFDVVTARAVANLNVLAEYCLPLVKNDGIFICMKGNNVEEIKEATKAIEKLGGKIENIEKINLPSSDIERNIIIIRKIKSTPKEYPRKAGTPSKHPLK